MVRRLLFAFFYRGWHLLKESDHDSVGGPGGGPEGKTKKNTTNYKVTNKWTCFANITDLSLQHHISYGVSDNVHWYDGDSWYYQIWGGGQIHAWSLRNKSCLKNSTTRLPMVQPPVYNCPHLENYQEHWLGRMEPNNVYPRQAARHEM